MKISLTDSYDVQLSNALLGYVGETNARPVTVEGMEVDGADRYVLTIDYGDGTVYDVDISDGTWTPTADVLRVTRNVSCQISARKYDNDAYTLVKKSKIFSLRIGQALSDGVAPIPSPSVAADALDRMTALGDRITADVQTAKSAAETATTAAENAEKSATTAGVSADTATQVAERAETAQTAAETSAMQADTARQGAETAHQQAVTHANAAKISADIAASAAQQTTADKTATADYAETAKTNADSAAADRQAVTDMAEQVAADKTTVADNAAQVAADRNAAENAAQTAQAVAKKVDSSISDLEKIDKNFLVKSKNMLNLETLTVNAWISNTSGNVQPYDNWSSTDYIPIDDLTSIFFVSEKNGVYEFVGGNFGAFYDEQKRYISGFSGVVLENTLIPQNAKYIRISNKSLLFIKSVKPIISSIDIWNPVPTPEEYEGCGEVRFNDSENVLPNAYEAIKKNTVEIGRLKANVDFLAMLNGVELEVSGGEASYAKVKRYYDSRLWSAVMVHAAVGKWITAEEYTKITGQTYESEEQ